MYKMSINAHVETTRPFVTFSICVQRCFTFNFILDQFNEIFTNWSLSSLVLNKFKKKPKIWTKFGSRQECAESRAPNFIFEIVSNYSGDLKSDHLKSGNIWNPDFLKLGFQIVRFSNGRGFSYQPFQIRMFLSGFQMVFDKMAAICPNF